MTHIMKKTFILLLAAAAAFAACQKADVATPVADDSARVVKFSANNLYSFDTKSGSAFAAGEYVSVYAGSPIYASNVKYTIGTITEHAGSLTPTVENNVIKWGAEQFGTATATKFLAIYPWAESRSIAENGTLDYDIANDEEYASYFMTAAVSKASNNANDLAVNFAFTHPFVKLSYSITAPGDDAISTVKMYNVKRTGTIAFNTGAATAADGGAISSSDAYTVSGSAGSYSTIIIIPF